MSIFDRVRSLFRGAAPIGSAVFSTGSAWSGPGPRRGTRELFAAYRTSPWLHAVENRLAHERATATRLALFDGPDDDPERVQIKRTDPRYQMLRVWRAPARLVTGQVISQRQRVKLLALWYGLAGEAYLLKQRNEFGAVVGLVPISPLWVTATPSVGKPWYEMRFDASKPPERILPHNVIPLVDLDAENPYGRGVGIGATLDTELDTDEGTAELIKATVLNHGVPHGLLVVKGVEPEEVTALETRWKEKYGGPSRAGQVAFARGEAQFIPLDRRGLFGESLEARKHLRDTFIQVHGISPEIFGVLDGSTRDSAYVAYYHLALGCLVPWLDAVSDALQAHLVPDFSAGDDLWSSYQSPIPEDRELKLRCVAVAPKAFKGRDLRQIGAFAPDAELDNERLGDEAQVATESQLPQAVGLAARLRAAGAGRDPAWALALGETSRVG